MYCMYVYALEIYCDRSHYIDLHRIQGIYDTARYVGRTTTNTMAIEIQPARYRNSDGVVRGEGRQIDR